MSLSNMKLFEVEAQSEKHVFRLFERMSRCKHNFCKYIRPTRPTTSASHDSLAFSASTDSINVSPRHKSIEIRESFYFYISRGNNAMMKLCPQSRQLGFFVEPLGTWILL